MCCIYLCLFIDLRTCYLEDQPKQTNNKPFQNVNEDKLITVAGWLPLAHNALHKPSMVHMGGLD